MKMQLERLFIEGEHERIKQENIEKQQAEQIAAGMYDDLYHVLSPTYTHSNCIHSYKHTSLSLTRSESDGRWS